MFSWFESRLDPFPTAEPKQPPKTLLAFCRHYTAGVWPAILVMGALTSLIAILEVSMFSFLGNIVDWLAQYKAATFFTDARPELLLMAGVVLVALPLTHYVHSSLIHQTLLGNYPMRIRWAVHRYLIRQSMTYFQHEFSGRVATKLMQTALAVRESVMKLLDVLNYVAVYFLGAVWIAARADFWLMVPFLVWLACYVSLLRYFVPKLGKIGEEQANARSVMTGRIVDSYTNIATVKLFSHTKREEVYAKESMQDFLGTVHAQMRLITKLYMTLNLLNASLLFSTGWLSLSLWTTGAVSIGAVAVAIGLVLRMGGMSQWIMWEASALFENIGTVEDGISSIALPRVVEDEPNAPPLKVNAGAIEFRDVTFHYGKGSGVLSGVSLKVKPGERVGIVGRSGAGKSTLVNLLLRFYDVESGQILIDGQEIAKVSQDSLRANIGMVTQDTSLLHRSVRDNILYGRPDATEEMLHEAADKSEAAAFIAHLSDPKGRTGYDAHVGERGVTLSGGQRQRIAIARVMLKDAPILILDEATSALDSEVEAAIQQNLEKLMHGKTVIAIAHRLSTIAALDRLIVIDGGKVVEDGTHQELVARGGLYSQLWARQSGGFLGAEKDDKADKAVDAAQ